MRIFALLGFLLAITGLARPNSALVLMSPTSARPQVLSETFSHPLWVTWPRATDGSGINQLASIVTQRNLDFRESNFSFRRQPDGTYLNTASDSLDAFHIPKGFWVPIDITVLELAGSGIDQRLLAMVSCNSPVVQVRKKITYDDNLVYCAKASTWDDVAIISRAIQGSTVVIEFPPRDNHRWSRIWIYKNGKVEQAVRYGVISSTRLLDLDHDNSLIAGEPIQDPGHSQRSGSPDRWLAVGELSTVIRSATYLFVWIAVFITLGFLATEVSKIGSRIALYLVLAIVFANRLLPAFLFWSGVQMWWLWLILCAGGIFATFVSLDFSGEGDHVRPLAVVGLPLLLITSFLNWNASPFGPIYSLDTGLAPEWVGFQIVFAGYMFIRQRDKSGLPWFLAMISLPIFAVQAWMSQPNWPLGWLSIVAVGLFLWPGRVTKIVAIIATIGIAIPWTWVIGTLFWPPLHQERALIYEHFTRPEIARQFLRPEAFIGILAALSSFVFSSKFESHRLGKTLRESIAIKPILWLGVFVAIWSINFPPMLGVLPWVIAFAGLFWAQESLWNL